MLCRYTVDCTNMQTQACILVFLVYEVVGLMRTIISISAFMSSLVVEIVEIFREVENLFINRKKSRLLALC